SRDHQHPSQTIAEVLSSQLKIKAAEEWRRRVIAEYNSAGVTHSLVGWLLKLGASPTLLHEGVRIIDDELVHAEMAYAVLCEADETAASVDLSAGSLGLTPDPARTLLEDVCVHGVRTFCLGETIAVRLFKRLREGATIASARRALDRVLIDEVRHRDFGWLLLEWLAQSPHWPSLAQLIRTHLPGWLRDLHGSYAPVAPGAAFDPALRAWGLMPLDEYRAALLETIERDYVPRFAEYEIDAQAALDS
ncbi:MAG TPA: hypothetical protein VGC79_24515, partial [Polyangiaceae bacterium]